MRQDKFIMIITHNDEHRFDESQIQEDIEQGLFQEDGESVEITFVETL